MVSVCGVSHVQPAVCATSYTDLPFGIDRLMPSVAGPLLWRSGFGSGGGTCGFHGDKKWHWGRVFFFSNDFV